MSKTQYLDYEKGGLQKEYYSKDEVMTRTCPLCGSENYLNIYKERKVIGIVRCKECGLIYTNPTVRQPEKNYWGDEKKYYAEAKLIFDGKAKSHRDVNYLEDLSIIERLRPEGNFLDIGTNMGLFLRHTRGKRWNVFGVEPSPVLSEMARKYFGLNVKTAYMADAGFDNEFFDIVTMTDVFEHIEEPKKMLQDIRRVLKNDGILFIKVPNGSYNLLKLQLAKISGKCKEYNIFDSYEHVTHYAQKTLIKMLEKNGFKVQKISIGRPIQLPVWHRYVGHFYEYPSPWIMDTKNYFLRNLFYLIAKLEFILRGGKIGYFASNITVIASKSQGDKNNAR